MRLGIPTTFASTQYDPPTKRALFVGESSTVVVTDVTIVHGHDAQTFTVVYSVDGLAKEQVRAYDE